MLLEHRDTILPAPRRRRRVCNRPIRTRTTAIGLVISLMLLMLSMVASAGSVGAASPAASGWWWRPQAGAGGILIPNPPSVPADGLAVGGAPDGPSAIAAVRYALLSDETPIKLTLMTSGETGGEAAVITACPAGGPWEPAQTGKWENRPQAACGYGYANGVRSTDGKTWTFNIEAFPPTVPGFADIVFVPGTVSTPAGAVMPTFQISFNKPDSVSLQTTQPLPSSTGEYESLGVSTFAPVGSEVFSASPAVEPLPPDASLSEVPAPIAPQSRQLSSAQTTTRPAPNLPAASRLLFPIVLILATLHFGYAYVRSRQAARALV